MGRRLDAQARLQRIIEVADGEAGYGARLRGIDCVVSIACSVRRPSRRRFQLTLG
jgi:hypothetical protein